MENRVVYVGENFFESELSSLKLKIGNTYTVVNTGNKNDIVGLIMDGNMEYYSSCLFMDKC